MKKRLIIAEKPAMGADIANALPKPHKRGNGFIETAGGTVTWCIGHVLASFSPEDYNPEWGKWSLNNLPMIPETWKYKVEPSKAKQFKVIKDLLKDCDYVINAGDPGREGQVIVDEVLEYLNNKKPVQRILLYALDNKSIQEAFNNLQDNANFKNLYEAGKCRSYADWIMGMNGTCVFTLKAQETGYKGVLSVGRVQSPTLAIVVQRDEIIENFIPKTYFVVSGLFSHANSSFTAYWKPQDNTPANILDEEKRIIDPNFAMQIANKIQGKQAKILNYEEKPGKEYAPLPFNLSKMQIYANKKWGMSAKTVLDTCQSLYEVHKIQTYPRTDCQYLPENQFNEAGQILAHIAQGNPNLEQLVKNANTQIKSAAWNDSKLGEHYGLIPTKKPADLSALSENERRIYTAVCESYIAQFYPPCEYNSASVLIECEQEHFKANGKTIINLGWKVIYKEDKEEEETGDEEKQVFPNLQTGINILCKNGKSMEKKTTPPPRFTEGSLIEAMTNVHTLVTDPEQKKKLKDKKGIGQEATRTQIIENLLKRQLLLPKGKQIISSEAGRVLVDSLPKKVTSVSLTAVWEDALDQISEGKLSPTIFKEKQNQWIAQLVAEAKQTTMKTINSLANYSGSKSTNSTKSTGATKSNNNARKDKGTCPKCQKGTLYEGKTKTGKKVIGCSNWNKDPKCDYVKWIN